MFLPRLSPCAVSQQAPGILQIGLQLVAVRLVESALHRRHGEDDAVPHLLCLPFHRWQCGVGQNARHAADGAYIRLRLVLRLGSPPPYDLPDGDASMPLVVGAEQFEGGTQSEGHGGEGTEGAFALAVGLTEPPHCFVLDDVEGVDVSFSSFFTPKKRTESFL